MLKHLLRRLFCQPSRNSPVGDNRGDRSSVPAPAVVPIPDPIREVPKPVADTLSKLSRERLSQCHPDLQRVVELAAGRYPMAVIQGHRGEKEQNEAFSRGNSKLKWPNSKHNSLPSMAVDLVPMPLDWNNVKRFDELAVVVKAAAKELGVELVWGGDWKSFKDRPHYELRRSTSPNSSNSN